MRRNTSSGLGVSLAKGIPPLDSEMAPFYHAMGWYIAGLSAVDHWLASVIMRMISPGNAALSMATPLVAGSDFRVKLSQIKHLAALHLAPELPDIRSACNSIQEMYQRRNELAHSSITAGRKPGEVCLLDYRITPDGDLPPEKYLTVANIEAWHQKLGAATKKLALAITKSGYPPIGSEPAPELVPGPIRRLEELLAQLESRTGQPIPSPRKRRKPRTQPE